MYVKKKSIVFHPSFPIETSHPDLNTYTKSKNENQKNPKSLSVMLFISSSTIFNRYLYGWELVGKINQIKTSLKIKIISLSEVSPLFFES